MRSPRAVCASALALALGCGPSPAYAPERAEPAGAWTPAPDDFATPFVLGQTWIGRVRCARGEILIALHVTDIDDAHVRALVELEGDRGEGLFEVTGRWLPESREADLVAGRRLRMPADADTFGLRGRITLSERRFMGVADGAGCGAFSLRAVPPGG